jgi:2-oxoisovalerate dehydrogenase E1 component
MQNKFYEKALLIRQVEEKFLELFSEGKLNGTVHTSVGQEFSAIAFAGQINKTDFIFSNHRCHGHYLEFTNDLKGLIAELMGKKVGTCGGIGSSQHLCHTNFFSNGVQGGIVPLAAGFALANKLRKNNQIGIVFIGDGTLGEGVVYETLNIISKWEIPLLLVCENNQYAQSTPITKNLAGDILKRAEAFNIASFKSNTWDVDDLMENARNSIEQVRTTSKPVFHLVETYRLNAHSKSDDNRNSIEIEEYRMKDPINLFRQKDKESYESFFQANERVISGIIQELSDEGELSLNEYIDKVSSSNQISWQGLIPINKRQSLLINEFFVEQMSKHQQMVFMGEDVQSPYGGAFKIAKGLSDLYPERVFSSPISEAALTGIGNGLALAGMRPFIEIMFGDFITLAFDQILNHASKFYHMYHKKAKCPLVLRTPMGGRRGYGPTHSQTLDKFLIGIDNVKIIAINALINPKIIYNQILDNEEHPVIVIENKVDYGSKIFYNPVENYNYFMSSEDYPTIKISPKISEPTGTIVTYGGMTEIVLENILDIFSRTEIKPEIIILTKIHPIDYEVIIESVNKTGKLYVIEEGSVVGGIGSEVIASVMEKIEKKIICRRIGSVPVPIPAVNSLEEQILPNKERIVHEIKKSLE